MHLMKSERKRKQIMRKFKNVCMVMKNKGMEVHERHNIFCDCVTQARNELKNKDLTDEQKVKMNLRAQEIFIEKELAKNPSWYEGVKL